jgi:hypothetical protein
MILTNSEVSTFQRCSREWQHRYIDHRTGPEPSDAQSRGTRIHQALAHWWTVDGRAVGDLQPIERAMVLGYAARYQRPHLEQVRVNVPFRVELPGAGVTMVGSLDVLGVDPTSERTVIVEHKSTSQDITPGSSYWSERIHCDSQVSTYLLAFPDAFVTYDALKVPGMRPLAANSRRKEPESDDEYVTRVLDDMSETPEKYFQRAAIVRLADEHESFVNDLTIVAESMHPGAHPRNPRGCFAYGRRCDFFGVCWQGQRLESLPLVEKNHTEEMADAYDKSFVPIDRLRESAHSAGLEVGR